MSGDLVLETNDFLPLREVVYRSLRAAILKEQIKPGERLMENTVAEKLGVSRTPVRESFRMLSDEGLVELIPRRGARVAQISRKQMNEVLEVRKSLEILAIKKACQRIGDEDIKRLFKEADSFRNAANASDTTAMAEADVRFHDIIYAASDNKKLVSILENLYEQMYRFRFEYLKNKKAHESLADEHDSIAKAVSEKDAELAEKLIRIHIDNQQESITDALESAVTSYSRE